LPPFPAHEHAAKAIYIVTRYKWTGIVPRALRDADPRCFTTVMATGIVSVALRLIGQPDLSRHLDGGLCLDDRLDRRPSADRGLAA
jgi:hypothetical protein